MTKMLIALVVHFYFNNFHSEFNPYSIGFGLIFVLTVCSASKENRTHCNMVLFGRMYLIIWGLKA